jgi:predicted hydrocarbon binding protein
MSRSVQMANNHWHPLTCATAGGFKRSPCHPAQGAAARLLHAIVRWQIRRLERRLASLELDERCLH